MRDDKHNVIVDKSVDFSLAIIKYCEVLEQDKKFVIARQLLRSSTSIGANIFEAQNAESKADFIHKMKLVLKELRETMNALRIIKRKPLTGMTDLVESCIKECNELISILVKSIETAQRNNNNDKGK